MNTEIKAPKISYVEAKYLKHAGKIADNTKVTIKLIDGVPVVCIRDFEFNSFRGALVFIQDIVEHEIVSETPDESLQCVA